jgi:hypothetical protein
LAAFCALRDEAPSAPFPLTEDDMTTPRTHAIVSLTATMAVTLVLGACVPGPSVPALDRTATMGGRAAIIPFDNDSHDYVHVYLVDGRDRQWLLGRVEPWSRATLRIPAAALAGSTGFVQLAVLTSERITPQVARHPRAMLTVAQPASAILSLRWMFAHGQLTPLPLERARGDIGRQ